MLLSTHTMFIKVAHMLLRIDTKQDPFCVASTLLILRIKLPKVW